MSKEPVARHSPRLAFACEVENFRRATHLALYDMFQRDLTEEETEFIKEYFDIKDTLPVEQGEQ